jgi:cytochrome b561
METKQYSAIYRVMHWLIAFSLIALLFTIFLRMTWMNKNNMAEIIRDYMSTTDQSLSEEQLLQLAKKIRNPMWDWHIYMGYFLVGLFSIRITLPFFGEMTWQNPLKNGLNTKQRFQFWVYIVFYVFLSGSLITGMMIEFGPKNWLESLETVHKWSIYYLLIYILLHMGGVLMAEKTNQKGIVSKMI